MSKAINFNELDITEFKLVMVDGKAFIARAEELEDSVVLSDALDCGTYIDEDGINNWIKKGHLGELSNPTIKGALMYTIDEIPDDMKIYFKKRIMSMKQAIKCAIPKLVNNEFDRTR